MYSAFVFYLYVFNLRATVGCTLQILQIILYYLNLAYPKSMTYDHFVLNVSMCPLTLSH